MWPFTEDEELDEITSEFEGVSQGIFEQAETEEAGLLAMQDAYKSYEFSDPEKALNIFQEKSSEVRKKFGDTHTFDFQTTLELAPRNLDEFTSDLPDPEKNKIDIINQWQQSNMEALAEATDLNQIQLRPQLERSIRQIGNISRRQVYGSDNYLVTDQALRMAQGAIGPIAELVGADSVTDFFTENTDPDGASVFGYTIGGDESYWSAISSGLGSVAGAVGAGVATGGWGTAAYLGASGAGSVRARVEDALENEASTEEAIAAGGIEAASQIAQTVVGTKVFGGAVNKILGKSPTALGERIFPKLMKAGALEGTTEAGGQVVSNVGQNVGRGDELDSNLLEGVPQSFVAGFAGGGLATGVGEVFAPQDSQGNPVVADPDFPADSDFLPGTVYHGTSYNIQDFDRSTLGKSTGSPSAKKAFFASPQVQTAEFFGDLSSRGKEEISLARITLKDNSWQEAKDAWKEVDRIYGEIQEYSKANPDAKNKRDVLSDPEYLAAVAKAKESNKQNDEKAASKFNELKKKDAGTNIVPLRIRSVNPYTVNAKGKPDAGGLIYKAVTEAIEGGHDSVIINNMEGGGQYVAWFDPEQAYSPWELKSKRKMRVDPILETDGLPPPKQEVIPGKAVSAELLEPGIARAKLADGSEIVESDGKFHLKKDDKVLQAYDTVKMVAPEVAQKIRQLQADGNPDGTAVTITTDGENLLIESEFIDDKLNPSQQKTGKTRVAIPLAESAKGAVPVFASKTRTTDGVRQNPSFISPAPVESTASAATAGYGQQYLSPYMQRMIEKYGPDLSEELGIAVKGNVANVDGTVDEVLTPLTTKFKTTHAITGTDAAQFIDQNGIFGTLEYLRNNNKFNEVDAAASNIVVNKIDALYRNAQTTFSEDQSPQNLAKLTNLGDVLNESMLLKDKVSTTLGRGLGSLTNVADQIHNARAYGEFRVGQIEAELTKAAYDQYQKDTGEAVNIPGWAKEAQDAEAVIKANTPKEGEVLSQESQSQLAKAKEVYDKAVSKIKNADKIKKEKISEFTPDDKNNLIDMYSLLGKLDGEMKLTYAEKVFEKEAALGIKDIDSDRFNQLYNFFRSNLLSGPSTQLRNFVGNTTKVMSDIVGLIGAGQFQEAGVFLDQWIGSTELSLKDAKQIVQGNRAGRFKFDQKATDKKGNVKAIKKAPPLTNPFTAIQHAMYRLLTAQDAVFFRNANTSMAYLAEYVANKNIKDPAERKAYIEKALGYDQRESISEQVTKEAKLLKDAGMEISQDQIDLDVAYRMEKLRSEKTKEIADKFGDRSVFVNEPSGLMGALYEGLEIITEKIAVPIGGTTVKPLRFFMPFTKVAANVTSHIMEFTPVGVFKGYMNNPDAEKSAINHQLSDIDAKMVLGRGIVGSTFMAGFFAFADAFKDEEDPYVAFYGYPPKGKWKEWQARGIDPFSMKLGNNIIPLQGTSLAIIPAIVGGMVESIKAGASHQDAIMSGAMSSLGAVSTMSFLKPAGDLFDYLMGSKDVLNTEVGKPVSGATEKRRNNFLKAQADTIASGFIPASGFINNLGRWTNESPVESYNNLAAKVFGEMPFSKAAGLTDNEPQLNIFGAPITKSLVQRMSAGLAPHTIKTDPTLLWLQETGFSIPDQGPIVSLTRKAEKERFGQIQQNITGYANILDEKQSRRVLQLSGPRIKSFLDSIRKNPAFQVKGEKAQAFINDKINEIRAEAKVRVMSTP